MPLRDRIRKLRDEVDNFIGGPPPTSYQQQQQPYPQQYQQPPYQQPPYQQQYQQHQPYPPQPYPQQGYGPPPQQQGGYPQQYHQGPPPQGYFAPQQQQQHFSPPPPVPPHPPATEGVTSPPPIPSNKPGSPPPVPSSRPADVYWKPRLATDTHVSEAWDMKLGNADGWGNHELQHYTSESQNAFHTPSGTLVLRAIASSSHPEPSERFTSARLVSRQTFSRDRGVLSATILAPCAKGIWPAFWLLPQEPFKWPVDGEVDIMETWNGDCENRTCLHWGQHNEPQKHRVLGTKVPDMASRVIKYELAWDQPDGKPGTGRLIWYMDGRPVMKADVPPGTRPLRDMTVLLNVAMGGDVCQGKKPDDGWYDLVVFDIHMKSDIDGGWDRFNRDWGYAPQGNTY